MNELGITEDVEYLFEKSGFWGLMTNPHSTYKTEALQFLASVEGELFQGLSSHEAREEGLGYITLTVYRKDYVLAIKTLEDMFGFHRETNVKPKFKKVELSDLCITMEMTPNSRPQGPRATQSETPASVTSRKHWPFSTQGRRTDRSTMAR